MFAHRAANIPGYKELLIKSLKFPKEGGVFESENGKENSVFAVQISTLKPRSSRKSDKIRKDYEKLGEGRDKKR